MVHFLLKAGTAGYLRKVSVGEGEIKLVFKLCLNLLEIDSGFKQTVQTGIQVFKIVHRLVGQLATIFRQNTVNFRLHTLLNVWILGNFIQTEGNGGGGRLESGNIQVLN